MLYDYECEVCGTQFERILRASQCDYPQYCHDKNCQSVKPCKKIIVNGHGGFRRPDSEWIREIGEVFETPLNTVEDLRGFYADHPDVKPCESHPALPSGVGDKQSPVSVKEAKATRKKSAQKHLAKLRRVELTSRNA